jgi:hypothetical protein
MSDRAQEEHLARTAADIMFGDKYMDLLERVYSERDTIVEFETNPKQFLLRHGIKIPDAIDVVIHDPGTLNRTARVDFHWGDWAKPARPDILAARKKLRELARVAWDTLDSREMKQLRQTVQSSPGALKEFTSNPTAYARAQRVAIPDDMDLIVHLDDPNELRIDVHFDATSASSGLRPVTLGGCCYCYRGGCCYYARF